jgi:Reverse transcriptase (RNA-dependent DNA polymerase)
MCGSAAGVESAIHAMRGFLASDDSDGILLIDADNAFNRVNRATALWNVQYICPALKHVLTNFYRSPTKIFMNGDSFFELLSQEGTTQGCPLAMAMYALALVPLTKRLQPVCKQVWYADDATGCDKLENLRSWFDKLLDEGPAYGYFPKPAKCILVVKPDRLARAKEIFKGSGIRVQTEGSKDCGIEINCEGTRHLGAAVGNTDFRRSYLRQKITNWISAVKKLALIAASQPHAAFAAFTQCLQGQWTFLSRTMPDNSDLFQPLEDSIRNDFIRALFKRDINDLERDMLSLPARMGGMGLFKPTEECLISSTNSICISAPLVRLIQRQIFELDPRELAEETKKLMIDVDRESDVRFKTKRETVLTCAPDELKQAVTAASEKGASSWVTASPSYDHGTVLHKRDFVDACYMRYGWALLDLPISCACGNAFNLQHALDCKLGGLRIIQHNEVRDTIAQLMREAGHTAVELEPQLQPLDGEVFDYKSANKDEEARSDIKCCGFWSNLRQAYFDIKVVSPFARSNAHLSPAQLFKNAERSKIREYKERILNVEHADFNPLVFTTCGGMSPQSHIVLKRLAEKLSDKQNLLFSAVSGWLRCRLSFALLRTTLLCVRATRSKKVAFDSNIELAVATMKIGS